MCVAGLGISESHAAPPPKPPSAAEILQALEPGPPYRKLSIHLGSARGAKRSLFITDPKLPPRIPVAFGFWALHHEERLILIDTGFTNPQFIKQWGIQGHRAPRRALREALSAEGVGAAEVTDVIITHNHWDHIGGLSAFPNARVWITTTELRRTEKWSQKGAVPQALSLARSEGRLRAVDGLQMVAPGVLAVPVGLHTPGFQFVVVHSEDGAWIFASDIAPLRDNVARQSPTGQTSSRGRTLEVLKTMARILGDDMGRLIPGHDPGSFTPGAAKEL